MLSILLGSGTEAPRALSNNNGSTGELVEASAKVEVAAVGKTEWEGEVECEEAGDGLGWKFWNKSLTSSLNDVTCLICAASPKQWNQDST